MDRFVSALHAHDERHRGKSTSANLIVVAPLRVHRRVHRLKPVLGDALGIFGLHRIAVTTGESMCRNIKTLANFAPPATDDEIRASAVQFVRKLSGTTHPSHANEAAFNAAVDDVSAIARRLVDSITTKAPPRHREA